MSENKLRIAVIVGSTRQGRFSEKPAAWMFEQVKALPGVEAELLDLRDHALPFYDEPITPSTFKGNYPNEAVARWSERIKAADAFVIVTPEYNHGYPAVLKNALDYVYDEWHRKPVGFMSYGGVSGARVIEQLRLVSIELHMAPIREAVHIPPPVTTAIKKDGVPPAEALKAVKEKTDLFLADLLWWTKALKEARAAK
ncbi:MAG TPA: NAD(P)H-dependent oxidoreductase [Candidatus Binatia bacterium]|jgi:NAD(P)H-dependent FMN reductase|nr:NAD(P)H-dependent oxidoreductase [Candidatus Binatia bacterium]